MRGSNRSQILRWSYLACHLDLLKEKKHAQQESHITAKTSINAEFAEKDSASNRSSAANLTKLAAMLSSLDPEELAELLAQVHKK